MLILKAEKWLTKETFLCDWRKQISVDGHVCTDPPDEYIVLLDHSVAYLWFLNGTWMIKKGSITDQARYFPIPGNVNALIKYTEELAAYMLVTKGVDRRILRDMEPPAEAYSRVNDILSGNSQ